MFGLGNRTRGMQPVTPCRVLVLVTSANIGSAAVSLPVMRALRRHFGEDASLVICSPASPAMSVYAAACDITSFISLDRRSFGSLVRAWFAIFRQRFEAVVFFDPHKLSRRNLWKYRLFFRLACIPRLIGFHLRKATGPDASGRYPHVTNIRLEQLSAGGIDTAAEREWQGLLLPVPDVERESAHRWLAERRRFPERPLVVICPGANARANHWGMDRFIELGHRLSALACYELIVCGGPAEAAEGAALIDAWGQGINAAGELSVLESAAIFEAAAFHIGLDTGTTHLAAAVGTKSITVQGGRTLRGNWDPLGEGHIVLRFPVACEGCRHTLCPLTRHPCMRGITVDDVWAAVTRMRASLSNVDSSTALP